MARDHRFEQEEIEAAAAEAARIARSGGEEDADPDERALAFSAGDELEDLEDLDDPEGDLIGDEEFGDFGVEDNYED